MEWKTVHKIEENDVSNETLVMEISGVGCVVRHITFMDFEGEGAINTETMCFVPGASLTNDPAHPGEWRMEKR